MRSLEDLSELKSLCMRKLDKLLLNVEKYEMGCDEMFNLLTVTSSKLHRSECISSDFVRDSFLSSLTNVLECTLKLNGHLDAFYEEHIKDVATYKSLLMVDDYKQRSLLNLEGINKDEKNVVSYKSLLKVDKCKERSLLDLAETTKYSKTVVSESVPEVYNYKSDLENSKQSLGIKKIFADKHFGYLIKNFNDYGKNRIFDAVITWIDVSYFCVCPHEWKATALSISQLMNDIPDFEQYLELPPNDEVFGILIPDDGAWRAIRTSDVYSNSRLCMVYDIFLVDFGEPLTVQYKTKNFKLPKHVRDKPAQIIYCSLEDGITSNFKEYLFKEISLRVIERHKYELVVTIKDNSNSNYLDSSKALQANGTSKFCEDDWKILREEPVNTSNALKAVLGYVPKDEKRVCRFFNPNTGNCFKGANCHLEHAVLNQDGFTKDLLPTETVVQNGTLLTIYKKHSKLLISPTYIKSLTHFYAHIGSEQQQLLGWNINNLPYEKGLKHVPHTLEMVIAKFDDELYYRAQILEQFNEKTFKVYYVDYGNEGIVDVEDMAPCDETITNIPHQAVICRIAGVAHCETYIENQYETAICLLQTRLLDKSFVMKVIDQHDDLVLKFIEQNWKNFPHEMITLGFLKQYETKHSI